MLRIVEEKIADNSTILRLHGRVADEWIEVLETSCNDVFQSNGHGESSLILDLGGVSFADPKGARLLQQLEQREVLFINCSPFLQEQIKQPANEFSPHSTANE